MRNIFIAFTFLLTSISVNAQYTNIDSLKSAYYSDTNDINTLEKITDYYAANNIDSLNRYSELLLSIIDAESKNKTYIKIANALISFNDHASAEELIQNLNIDENSTPLFQSEYLLITGRLLKGKRKYDESLNNFYSALQTIKENKLNKLLPEVYSDIASILRENNDLINSTKYYRKALNVAVITHNIELQVKIYYALCRIFNGGIIVNLDSSIYYGELGVELSKKEKYDLGYATMIKVVAAPLIRQGQYRKGLEMSKEALLYSDKYNFSSRTQYYLINNQGFAYEKLGLYDSALIKMNEGIKVYPTGSDHFRLKYLIHKSMKNYAKALASFEIYKAKYDSIVNEKNESKLSSIQARREADIKGTEVISLTHTSELQAYQLTQQKYFLGVLFTVIMFMIAGGFMIYRQRKLKQQQIITNLELEETRKRLDIEKQYRASELKALRSQMNPHFIFNALNSIQEYIVSNERKQAGKYLGKFADLMRMYLHHSQTKNISLRDETDALSLYLELEKLRFEDSLSYSLTIQSDIDLDSLSIPSLIVQPYVENAIKHGLLHKKSERDLSISFNLQHDNQVLECIILDNGIGRKKSEEINKMRNPDHKSFALTATKTRLELLNYNYDKPIGEEIIDLYDDSNVAKGTKVILSIPIISSAI